ncbi:hypothetical protein EB796_023098 [Bugula neritina]|uniref:Uncharacterized protein n=1 Tax=Bugula neritina TaxID=10212 RepID=A0A7J7IXG0_BUGNE|nr:hypothetical protein EB796_023098 [Bugula neritina]
MHCMMGVKIDLPSDIATSTQQVPTPPQVLIEKELDGVFADTFNFADVKDKWWVVVAAPLVTTVFVMLLYLVYIVVKQHRQSRELRVASPTLQQ